MWIKIITTKKYNEMVKEMEELRGAHLHLHELQKGLYQKYLTETNELRDALVQREQDIEELNKKLRKVEHDRNEAVKKLKKYEAKKEGNVSPA